MAPVKSTKSKEKQGSKERKFTKQCHTIMCHPCHNHIKVVIDSKTSKTTMMTINFCLIIVVD